MHIVALEDAVWAYLKTAAVREKRSVHAQIAKLAADAFDVNPIPVVQDDHRSVSAEDRHGAQVLLVLARAHPERLLMRELEAALELSHLPVARAVQAVLNSGWIRRDAVARDSTQGRRAYRYGLLLTPAQAVKLVYENTPGALTLEERLGIQEDLNAGLGEVADTS